MTGRVREVLAIVLVVVAVGCGDREEGSLPAVDAPTAAPTVAGGEVSAGSGADVASGCWSEDQRVPPDDGVRHLRWSALPAMVIDPAKRYTGTFDTSAGSFQVELYPQEAPQTVNSFVCLARAGYYDGVKFHRILPGFVVQGGDPTGTGRGGPGYQVPDEPITRQYGTGTFAMARTAAPNSGGSQFFVVLEGGAPGLQQQNTYVIFGQVVSGMDVVNSMAGATIEPPDVSPYAMRSVTISES